MSRLSLRADVVWTVVSTLIVTGPAFKFYPVFNAPILLASCLSGPGAGLLITFLIYKQPAFYQRHRVDILTALRLSRILVALWGGRAYGHMLRKETNVRATQMLMPVWKALLLLLGSLGYTLPLARNAWIMLLALAGALATDPTRCAVDSQVPEYLETYQRMAGLITRAYANKFPISVARRTEAGRPPPDACMAVHCWTEVLGGFVLPILILDWSRQALQQHRAQQAQQQHRAQQAQRGQRAGQMQRAQRAQHAASESGFQDQEYSSSQSVQMVLHYLGLFVVSSAVVWKGLELALPCSNN